MDVESILLSTPIFRDLTGEAVSELLPFLRERSFAAGQTVWLEGDPADRLFVIADGVLKSHRISREGGDVILIFNSGIDVAGEVGLFHPSGLRQVNVTAMTPTRCFTLACEPLVQFMSRHPQAMIRMLERLSTIAVKAADSFSGVAFDDIRGRVAQALGRLADELGEESPDGVTIRVQLSQATLASLVAASRENVNRALSGLVATGAISHRQGFFVIHDRAGLDLVAHL